MNIDFEQYNGLIINLAKRQGIYYSIELEDLLQEGHMILWKAAQKYNGNGEFVQYYIMLLKSHFINIWKYYQRQNVNTTHISLDKSTLDNTALVDKIQTPHTDMDFEEIYFKNLVEYIIKTSPFTPLELKVFLELINCRIDGEYRVYDKIQKRLDLNHKTIDNALYRIRKKVKHKITA